MYNHHLGLKRQALAVDEPVTIYLARIYRNKLHTAEINCLIKKHPNYSFKMLVPQDMESVSPAFKTYLNKYHPPTTYFHLSIGYENLQDAIKSLYITDLTKFNKHYKRYVKTKDIISKTYPNYTI